MYETLHRHMLENLMISKRVTRDRKRLRQFSPEAFITCIYVLINLHVSSKWQTKQTIYIKKIYTLYMFLIHKLIKPFEFLTKTAENVQSGVET